MMKIVYALALGVMTLLNGCQQVVGAEKKAEDLGSIELQNDGALDCIYKVLDNRVMYIDFIHDDGAGGGDCGSDKVTSLSLKGVVAGVKITFCGNQYCKTREEGGGGGGRLEV